VTVKLGQLTPKIGILRVRFMGICAEALYLSWINATRALAKTHVTNPLTIESTPKRMIIIKIDAKGNFGWS
jgi:hypothetical protein